MARIRHFWFVALLLVVLSRSGLTQQEANAHPRKCVEPQSASDAKFSPGQVWSYRTREGEESSTITVLRVESLPTIGAIIHVRIDGIHLKNCSGGPSPTSIGHMPMSREALDRSVKKLVVQRSALPDYEEGYNRWRQDCGGVYTISAADVLKADETTFNSGMNCTSR